MLEEALREPSKHPGEVAQAMLSFIRSDLPNGGASSEERFFNMVTLLCARVFGEMQDSEEKEFRHEPGGWLSAQNRWRTTNATGSSAQQGRPYGSGRVLASPPIDADPVVQLLGPVQPVNLSSNRNDGRDNKGHLRSLIETISAEMKIRSDVQYHFKFQALPQPMQRQFLLVLEACMAVGNPNPHLGGFGGMGMGITGLRFPHSTQQQIALTQNSKLLFGSLLVTPQNQVEVVTAQHKKIQAQNQAQPLQLSPGLASPQSMTHGSPTISVSKIIHKAAPNLVLSMLEYYIFLFVRYPLAAPIIPRQSQPQSNFGPSYNTIPRRPQEAPYGERIYCTVFSRYLRYFLPHTQAATPYAGLFPPEMKESEFFLRSVIAFWLETSGSLLTTTRAAQGIMERFQRTGVTHSPLADLNMSYDLTISKFDPPPTLAQVCLRRLVNHVISDPAIYLSVLTQGAQQWCLTPAMTVLQQPFYNYIRSTFRGASIHAQGSVFYTALNAWLIWIEPWNVNHGRNNKARNATKRIISTVSGTASATSSVPTLTIPGPDRKSAYTKAWEPYLAANLFLYTVPLAIFLRRARELDFSAREMSRSMRVVKRVFRVFTPEVVNSLENITKSLNLPDFDGLGAALRKLAEHHRTNLLGDYAPSLSGNLSLQSCQAEVKGMLEEIMLQHMKRVRDLGIFDKCAAFLEGLFGHGVVSGEEMAIQSLVERAKTIVGLPIDYEIFSQEQSKSITANKGSFVESDSSTALRDLHGILTDEGRRQLLSGKMKCNPQDIGFVGDKMLGRLQSHEIGFLVVLTTALSTWLNKKFGLLPADSEDALVAASEERFHKNLMEQTISQGWRINLRWLADYRNLIFTFLCSALAWRIILA